MIEILEEGKKLNVIECRRCGSTLGFKEDSVLCHCDPWWFRFNAWDYFYIHCPKCEEKLVVDSVISKQTKNWLCQKYGITS